MNHPIKLLTAAQAVFKWSRATPSAPAVVYGSAEYTYLQLANHIARFVKALERCGVKTGNVVGIQCDSVYLGLLLLLTIDTIRAVPMYLSRQDLSNGELVEKCDFLLTQCEISDDLTHGVVINISNEWVNSTLRLEIASADIDRLNHETEDDDPAFLGGTSATTGGKKFFLDTRGAIQHQLALMADLYFSENNKNFICLYGVMIGAGYAGCCLALIRGGKIVFSTPDTFLEDVEKTPCSHSAIVLRDAEYLCRKFSDSCLTNKLSSIRILGAHLPKSIRAWLETHLAKRVVNSYSANEIGQVAEVLADGTAIIYPGVDVRIVDERRNVLPVNKFGYIAIRSPAAISGYLWNDELTEKHFSNGWFYSNDVGCINAANRLLISGRSDDMLNMGGVKIAPGPFENKIKVMDGVSDCVLLSDNAVFGTDRVMVCVEKQEHIDAKIIGDSVANVLGDVFSKFTICFLSNFPRTETGKIKRKDLAASVQRHFKLV